MIEIKTKDNEQDYRYVRIEVFMKEQGFQNEFDEIDATAVHITVYVRFMKAMAIPYAGRSIWMSMFLMYRWRSCCE